jgi:hypothetical protein
MSIQNWKIELAPLLSHLRLEQGFKVERYKTDPTTFKDQFGNFIFFGFTDVYAALELAQKPDLRYVPSPYCDKGHLSYSLYKHVDSYYVLTENRVDFNGVKGNFNSFVVLPSLEPLIDFLEVLIDPSE